MDLKIFQKIPPWEWPESTAQIFLDILRDDQADESERLLAVDLAGDFTVINDEIVDALLTIARRGEEPDSLRGAAVISLGPVLEQADIFEFDDPDDVPISEEKFREIQESLYTLYKDAGVPKEVRRRILEAAVRAPQDWHQDAIREAYAGDDAWFSSIAFRGLLPDGWPVQFVRLDEVLHPSLLE